jgi:hypothetical protein
MFHLPLSSCGFIEIAIEIEIAIGISVLSIPISIPISISIEVLAPAVLHLPDQVDEQPLPVVIELGQLLRESAEVVAGPQLDGIAEVPVGVQHAQTVVAAG